MKIFFLNIPSFNLPIPTSPSSKDTLLIGGNMCPVRGILNDWYSHFKWHLFLKGSPQRKRETVTFTTLDWHFHVSYITQCSVVTNVYPWTLLLQYPLLPTLYTTGNTSLTTWLSTEMSKITSANYSVFVFYKNVFELNIK